MSTPLPEKFTPHVVAVRDLQSAGGMGRTYADERPVSGFANDEQKLVRGADGAEVLSTSQVTVNFDEEIPIGSLVTVWAGSPSAREATVVAISRNHHPTLPSYQTLLLV